MVGPKVSLIVPIYNVESYLTDCLDSLIRQDYENLEIILVDDGSTDSSLDIANRYGQNHPNIHVLTKPNGGLSDARNYGIDHSSGEYCCFVDSDDWVADQYVSAMVQALDDGCEMVVCDMEYVYDDGQTTFSSGGTFISSSVTSDPELININNSACNKLVKTTIVKSFLFPKGKNYEDLATIPVWIALSHHINKVDQPLYFYRQRSGSIAHSTNMKIFDIYDAIDRCMDYFKTHGLTTLIPIMQTNYIRHGLDLTTLRIKDFDDPTQIIPYFQYNMSRLNAAYPTWRKDPSIASYPFKKRLIFSLLACRHYGLVKRLYGKN